MKGEDKKCGEGRGGGGCNLELGGWIGVRYGYVVYMTLINDVDESVFTKSPSVAGTSEARSSQLRSFSFVEPQ